MFAEHSPGEEHREAGCERSDRRDNDDEPAPYREHEHRRRGDIEEANEQRERPSSVARDPRRTVSRTNSTIATTHTRTAAVARAANTGHIPEVDDVSEKNTREVPSATPASAAVAAPAARPPLAALGSRAINVPAAIASSTPIHTTIDGRSPSKRPHPIGTTAPTTAATGAHNTDGVARQRVVQEPEANDVDGTGQRAEQDVVARERGRHRDGENRAHDETTQLRDDEHAHRGRVSGYPSPEKVARSERDRDHHPEQHGHGGAS